MKIMYKSLFRGWVEITLEQKENLIKHMNKGIAGKSGDEKKKYIESKFFTVE